MGFRAGTVGRMLGATRGRPRRLALHGGHRPLPITESAYLLPGIRLPGALASPVIVTVNSRWATARLPSGLPHDRRPPQGGKVARRQEGGAKAGRWREGGEVAREDAEMARRRGGGARRRK